MRLITDRVACLAIDLLISSILGRALPTVETLALNLIYQQRRQFSEAIRRFEAAVAIDSGEADANLNLAASRASKNGLLMLFRTSRSCCGRTRSTA